MSDAAALSAGDPSTINTIVELADGLDRLRRQRGLSYEAMQRAAAKRLDCAPLGKSSVGEIVTGKRPPSKEKLQTFLKVCGVSAIQFEAWIRAWERAVSPQPTGAVQVRSASARRFGVHAAIAARGAAGELPPYVLRDVDPQLRRLLKAGADAGCLVVLVGGPSSGKSRTLFEGIKAVLPDWWLVQPSQPADVRKFAELPAPRSVVWLDEFQRFLNGEDGLTSGDFQRLLRHGAVVVGTLWKDRYAAYTEDPLADPELPGELIQLIDQASLEADVETDYHPVNRGTVGDANAILRMADVIDLADLWSQPERQRASEQDDPRLNLALGSYDYSISQVLAAAPQLVRRWDSAPRGYFRALISAAVDAARLTLSNHLAPELLRSASIGYCTRRERAAMPEDWFERALTYATKLLSGAASVLYPEADSPGEASKYGVADFLVWMGDLRRRVEMPPDSLWSAFAQYLDDPTEIRRVGEHAARRGLLRHAERLLRRAVEAGGGEASLRLADLLADQGRLDEATSLVEVAKAAGDVDDPWLELGVYQPGTRDRGADLMAGLRLLAGVEQGPMARAAQLESLSFANDEQILEAYRQAAAMGIVPAIMATALYLQHADEYHEAKRLWRLAISFDIPSARVGYAHFLGGDLLNLRELHAHGQQTEVDPVTTERPDPGSHRHPGLSIAQVQQVRDHIRGDAEVPTGASMEHYLEDLLAPFEGLLELRRSNPAEEGEEIRDLLDVPYLELLELRRLRDPGADDDSYNLDDLLTEAKQAFIACVRAGVDVAWSDYLDFLGHFEPDQYDHAVRYGLTTDGELAPAEAD